MSGYLEAKFHSPVSNQTTADWAIAQSDIKSANLLSDRLLYLRFSTTGKPNRYRVVVTTS